MAGFGGVESVEIHGLKEVRRSLKGVSKDLPRELNKGLKVVVTETRDEARSRAESVYRPRRAASGIKGTFTGSKGQIVLDTRAQPTIAGNEFGGGAHGAGNPTSAGGHTTQFRPWRGNNADAGYAVFPAIRARQSKNRELVERQLTAFIDSNNL